MRELFVYYRVRAGDEAVALAIVSTFQTELRQHLPHLGTRLLRRSESSGAPQTWMEIYTVDPIAGDKGVGADLQRTIETAARVLAPHIEGTRHSEVFVDAANVRRRT